MPKTIRQCSVQRLGCATGAVAVNRWQLIDSLARRLSVGEVETRGRVNIDLPKLEV